MTVGAKSEKTSLCIMHYVQACQKLGAFVWAYASDVLTVATAYMLTDAQAGCVAS